MRLPGQGNLFLELVVVKKTQEADPQSGQVHEAFGQVLAEAAGSGNHRRAAVASISSEISQAFVKPTGASPTGPGT